MSKFKENVTSMILPSDLPSYVENLCVGVAEFYYNLGHKQGYEKGYEDGSTDVYAEGDE
jgi:hypothetical protein